MKIIDSILSNSKSKNMKIKSIKFGSKVKKIFKNKNILKDTI